MVSSVTGGLNNAAGLSGTAGDVSTIFFGTVSGGLSAELTGEGGALRKCPVDIFSERTSRRRERQGAATGLTVSGLNHVMHRSDAPDNGYERDGNGGYRQVDTNGGDIIDYLYDENGNIIDRTLVYSMEYRTEFGNSSETRTFGYRGIPKYSSVPHGGHALIDPTGDIVYGYAGGGLAVRGLGIAWKGFVRYTGFPKQWFRFGPSYSHALGEKTNLSLRWGAGANHWKKIGSPTLQNWNKVFRTTKLPINSWRAADPGHFHIFPKSPFKF